MLSIFRALDGLWSGRDFINGKRLFIIGCAEFRIKQCIIVSLLYRVIKKFFVHQMITVQKNTQKYFKQFQLRTMIT
jgi:hypothetical protein